MRGIRTAGRVTILLGLVLAFAWTFTPMQGAGGASLWEEASRFDILLAIALAAGVVVGVAGFVVADAALLDRALTLVAGGASSVAMLLALEYQWREPLLVELACLVALLVVAGATLLALPAAAAERLAASLRGARPTRVRPPAPPASGIPAGWYPDPTGQFATRYWNGQAWTDSVQ